MSKAHLRNHTIMTTAAASSESSENHKLKKFNVPLGIITQGKTCLEKLKTLLKIIDSTTSILIRSSKRWSLAAAISVGIEEKDEVISDEDTLSGKTNIFRNFFLHLCLHMKGVLPLQTLF